MSGLLGPDVSCLYPVFGAVEQNAVVIAHGKHEIIGRQIAKVLLRAIAHRIARMHARVVLVLVHKTQGGLGGVNCRVSVAEMLKFEYGDGLLRNMGAKEGGDVRFGKREFIRDVARFSQVGFGFAHAVVH